MPQRSSKSGVSLAEYGLILACVVCVCIAALQSLGSQISGSFDFISQEIGKVSGSISGASNSAIPPAVIPNLNDIKPNTNMNPYPEFGIAGTAQSFKPREPGENGGSTVIGETDLFVGTVAAPPRPKGK